MISCVAAEAPLKETGVLTPCGGLSSPGRSVTTKSNYKNQGRFWPSGWDRWKETKNPDVPHLKFPCTDSPADTHPGRQQRVGSSGGTRDIGGKAELCGTGARAGGTATIVPFLEAPPEQCTDGSHCACVEPFLHTANFEAALALWDQPSLPNPQIVHNGLLPRCHHHPALSRGHTFCARNKTSAWSICTI